MPRIRQLELFEPVDPARVLYAGILYRAMKDLSFNSAHLDRADAIAWINGRDGVVSFSDCVRALDLGGIEVSILQRRADEAEKLAKLQKK